MTVLFLRVVDRLNEGVNVKSLEQCPAGPKHSINISDDYHAYLVVRRKQASHLPRVTWQSDQ